MTSQHHTAQAGAGLPAAREERPSDVVLLKPLFQRTASSSQMAELLLLEGWLPVPLSAGTKSPAKRHAPPLRSDGSFAPPAWSFDAARAFRDWNSKEYCLGVLCCPNEKTGDVLFVIDCDCAALYETLSTGEHADAVSRAALQKTRAGYHVVFRRTAYANARGVWDNFKLYNAKGTHVGDIKTLTNSVRPVEVRGEDGTTVNTYEYRTPGNLSVFPSPNKSWLRGAGALPLLDPEHLVDVPDRLVDELVDRWGRVKPASKKRTKAAARQDEGGAPKAGAQLIPADDDQDTAEARIFDFGAWTPTAAHDAPCLEALGFGRNVEARKYVRTYDGEPTRQPYTLGCYQFASSVTPCPICAASVGHQSNQYYVLYTDAERRVFNFSGACCRSGRPIRWSDEGRRRWTDALAGTPHAALAAALAVPTPCDKAPADALPAELSFFAEALRMTLSQTAEVRLGSMFRPDAPGKHVLLATIPCGDGTVRMLGVSRDGYAALGNYVDHRVAAWTTVGEAAQRTIDAELRAWFAAKHADVPRDDGDVFVVPACCDDACDWGLDDPYVRTRAVRRHAACSTRTTRPWAFLRAMRAHAALQRETAAAASKVGLV